MSVISKSVLCDCARETLCGVMFTFVDFGANAFTFPEMFGCYNLYCNIYDVR